MEPTMEPRRRYGKSRTRCRGHAIGEVQGLLGAASPDAAQKQISREFGKIERIAFTLIHNHALQPVVAHLARLTALLASGPATEITNQLRLDGRLDRVEAEGREDCMLGTCTPAELDVLEARVKRQITGKYTLLRSIWGLRQSQRGAA